MATTFAETPNHIQGHLRYLAEKGYVELHEVEAERREYLTATLLAKLTSRGVDLLEASIPADPGIDCPAL